MQYIKIRGARTHNLKNINLDIPRNKLVVITGVSGSGKSSLAFDTLYAEGQRRYVESLSTYARQFLGIMEKAEVDSIEGLSPAIAIDQKAKTHNPRSTVGTVTEIYDYLRLLFARIGLPHCPKCGKLVQAQTIDEIYEQITQKVKGKKFILMAPLLQDRKGEHKKELQEIESAGFARVRLDGIVMEIEEALEKKINKNKRHNLEIVIDRLVLNQDPNKNFKMRLMNSLETALDLGNGLVMAEIIDSAFQNKNNQKIIKNKISCLTNKKITNQKILLFSRNLACKYCKINLPDFEPRNFSFNSPHGACLHCSGLGITQDIDPDLIIHNKNLSITEGAIKPWIQRVGNTNWQYAILKSLSKKYKFSLKQPVKNLSKKNLEIILYGVKKEKMKTNFQNERGNFEINPVRERNNNRQSKSMAFSNAVNIKYEGVIPNLYRRYKETHSDYIRKEIEGYMRKKQCPACHGARLRKESLSVLVNKKNIIEITEMNIKKCLTFFQKIQISSSEHLSPADQKKNLSSLTIRKHKIIQPIVQEIIKRLEFLKNVGLSYLTLARSANTLSGGEAQRIHLATQIGSQLSGVLYVLDEPSIGLHMRDNHKLIKSLRSLRDLKNSVIVVEHDAEMMLKADYLIDIGPGAGKNGGKVIVQGSFKDVAKDKNSLTGQYLSGQKTIPSPKKYRQSQGKLKIIGANEFNLKKIDVEIPLGCLVCVTGVSGSGKSTLIQRILVRALKQRFHRTKALPGKHREITGMHLIDKIIAIDQSPIGRTPRSNPATYTGLFNYIRTIFAQTPEAKIRGYKMGRFSFNVKGGRCEACKGEGEVKIEMHFLPDIYVKCEECKGARYTTEALEIYYKEKNIAEVLKMNAGEAYQFFANIPSIKRKLKILKEVGLDYLELGQPATTLSGGEAQRIKLAKELSKRATGRTFYVLDEPTIGLHFDDVKKLLEVTNKLVNRGNTVLIIEHNLDVIKCADWIIDLGPEGGDLGGYLVACGAPPEVAKAKHSYTGQYLAKII